jgi:hypothetical protein
VEEQHRCTDLEGVVVISESQPPRVAVVQLPVLAQELVVSCFPSNLDHRIWNGEVINLNSNDEEVVILIQGLSSACRLKVMYQHSVFVVYLKRPSFDWIRMRRRVTGSERYGFATSNCLNYSSNELRLMSLCVLSVVG